MLETIEKLLILQDRDRRIRRVKGELAHIEPERQMFQSRAAGTQSGSGSRQNQGQATRV